MPLNYESLISQVDSLISEFGKTFIIRKKNKGVYNPSTNTLPITSEVDYNVKGVRLNYKRGQIDNEVIKQNDFKLIISSHDLQIQPTIDDIIFEDNTQFKIITITDLKPANMSVYYELQVRP